MSIGILEYLSICVNYHAVKKLNICGIIIIGDKMENLIKLGNKTYCLQSPVNIGFYLINDKDVCLIDSGNSKDYGVMISKILEEKGWNLKYIINTHSHADHIGGNKYLQNKYNCQIYSSKIEAYFIENPELEPAFLYGATVINELHNHFLEASPSKCNDIKNCAIDGIEIVDLKGHCYRMIGVLTSDNVLFLGDAYTSEEILKKYTIQYIYDVEDYVDTLKFLLNTNYDTYVPAHGEIEKNPRNTIEANMKAVTLIENKILDLVQNGISYSDLINKIFNDFHIKINLVQFYLISATIKAYLTKLKNTGKITMDFVNNELFLKIGESV